MISARSTSTAASSSSASASCNNVRGSDASSSCSGPREVRWNSPPRFCARRRRISSMIASPHHTSGVGKEAGSIGKDRCAAGRQFEIGLVENTRYAQFTERPLTVQLASGQAGEVGGTGCRTVHPVRHRHPRRCCRSEVSRSSRLPSKRPAHRPVTTPQRRYFSQRQREVFTLDAGRFLTALRIGIERGKTTVVPLFT